MTHLTNPQSAKSPAVPTVRDGSICFAAARLPYLRHHVHEARREEDAASEAEHDGGDHPPKAVVAGVLRPAEVAAEKRRGGRGRVRSWANFNPTTSRKRYYVTP